MKNRPLIRSALFLFVLAVFNVGVEARAESSRQISMDFESADLKDVLKIFSQQSGLNFVASQDIENKKVTVYLDRVPVQEALEVIIKANGLRYDQKPDTHVFAVYPQTEGDIEEKLRTRVFHLRYMRFSISPMYVGGQSVVDDLKNVQQFGGSSSSSGSSSQSSGSQSSSQQGAASGSSGGATAQKGADKLVASLLSKNGKVSVDTSTNSLIVRDTPEKLDEIEKVLATLDVPSAQVMIEVHLMEVSKNVADDLGVDWGGTNGALATFAGGKRTTAFPFGETLFKASKGVKASAVTSASTLTLGTLSAENFTATLRFLTTHTDTKILARPRVLTLNNEAAQIKLVTNAAIANTTTIAASQGQSTTTSNQADRTEVGISLKMTPQINDDQSIALYLEPAVTTVAAAALSSSFLDPTTRSIRTTVRVKNHETLVIGGLIDSNKSLARKKIPFLGDLPLAGKAFSYDNGDYQDRELLIFITPHIVEGYDSLTEESATTDGKELAVKRMLDSFKEDRVRQMMAPFDAIEDEKEGLYRQERERIQASQKKAFQNPAVEKKMTQALDSFVAKIGKPAAR